MKKSHRPQTKTGKITKHEKSRLDYSTAWADRITFEEIKENISQKIKLVKIMRNTLKPSPDQTLDEKRTFQKHQTQKKIRIL